MPDEQTLLLYQHEALTCPELMDEDAVHIIPLSTCPVLPRRGILLHPQGSHVDVLTANGGKRSIPCGDIIGINGLSVYIACSDYPLEPIHRGVDVVLVYSPVWGARGDALKEARRLTYRLMTLSFLSDAPVAYVNRWGVVSGRVFIGATGLYDYNSSLPVAAGGYGDAVVRVSIRQRGASASASVLAGSL